MAEKIDTNEFLHCSCTSSKDNIEEYPELKDILPDGFKYTVCHWRKVDADHFEVKFRVNVATENDYDKWFYMFKQSSKTKFIRDKTLPKFKEVILTSLRCEEMTPVKKPSDDAPERKNADPSSVKPLVYFEKKCTTRIVMIVKLCVDGFAKVCDIPDVHLDEFPMTVIYHHLHNHPPVDFSPCHNPPPFMVDESKLSEQELQNRQILAALSETERHLQEMALNSESLKRAGHAPEEFKIKDNPFSLASLYDALSSINLKYEKHNSGETGNGCLLHFGKDSYSKALDEKSFGYWLAANSYDLVAKERAAGASTSVNDGGASTSVNDGGASTSVNDGGASTSGHLQEMALKRAGHAPEEFKIKDNPFSLASLHDALSSINLKYEKHNSGETGNGCLLHFGKDSYSKALDEKSFSYWLAANSYDLVAKEKAAGASTSVDDGGATISVDYGGASTSVDDGGASTSVDDGGAPNSVAPECLYMFTNPKISEKLKKIMEEAALEDFEK